MSAPLTEECLTIVWDGEWTQGILAYGYWQHSLTATPSYPVSAWPTGTDFKEHRLYPIDGDDWNILFWSIRICKWPDKRAWRPALQATLASFLAAGARISWCGIEGYFAEPPSLFDPKEMSEGVYASLADDLGFHCSTDLGKPFETLPDGHLLELRKLV